MNFLKKWQINRKCKGGELPDFICAYYDSIFNSHFEKKHYQDLRFVVLDTETTGLNTQKDVVLSIGAIAIEHKAIQVQDAFDVVLKKENLNFDAETVKVHGLTLEDIENGIEVSEAVREFLEYLKGDIIVAHHAAFDVAMLNKTISTSIGKPFQLSNPVLDTAYLARRLDISDNPYLTNFTYGLDELCRRNNIAMHDRHTAWGDAFITAKLFLMLTRRLENNGNKTLKDLMRKANNTAY